MAVVGGLVAARGWVIYSRPTMGIALALALLVMAGAHLGLVIGIARLGRPAARARFRAAVSLMVLPLAPWWGWAVGLRRTTMVWGAALALYVLVYVGGTLVTAR
jgi:hypothetical protein